LVLSDGSSEDFNLGVVGQSLVTEEGVLGFLSVEEGRAKFVEGFLEVIVGVRELGGKGDHVFHGTSQVGLFHRFIDLLEHHLLLGGSRSDSEGALEEDCSQNQANNESHLYLFIFRFL